MLAKTKRISPMWRRMFKAGIKCQEHIGWILGEGKISFWHDIWLSGVPLENLCSSRDLLQHQEVRDFWIGDRWNEEKLWRLYEELGVPYEVIEAILQIPFDRGERDRGRWKLTANGNFTVAPAWELVRYREEKQVVHEFIWGKCIGPTISVFLWRVLANRVPTDSKLQWRGISLASKCRCCCKPRVESRLHLFVNGDGAQRVWRYFARWFPKVPPFAEDGLNNEMRLRWWQRHMTTRKKHHISSIVPCLIFWFIWTERNNYVHREKTFQVENEIKRVTGYLRNLVLARLVGPDQWKDSYPGVDFMAAPPVVVRSKRVGRIQWRPLDLPWIKVNTDGSYQASAQLAGGGGAIRDHSGEILAALAAGVKAGSGLEAEAAAFLLGVILAKQQSGYIWIESDTEVLVGWINSAQLGADCVRHELARIRAELKDVVWRVTYIPREGNKAADHLAGIGKGCRRA